MIDNPPPFFDPTILFSSNSIRLSNRCHLQFFFLLTKNWQLNDMDALEQKCKKKLIVKIQPSSLVKAISKTGQEILKKQGSWR